MGRRCRVSKRIRQEELGIRGSCGRQVGAKDFRGRGLRQLWGNRNSGRGNVDTFAQQFLITDIRIWDPRKCGPEFNHAVKVSSI